MTDTLPIPPHALDLPSSDDVLAGLREAISVGVDGLMDKALEQLILPDDQAKLCLDTAQFVTFLMAIKICQIRKLPISVENLMKWYWPMQKALKDEVPGMIRGYAAAYAEREQAQQ